MGSPTVTVRAKSAGALMNAAAREVALLQGARPQETVLVVYGDHAASLFCEPGPETNQRQQR